MVQELPATNRESEQYLTLGRKVGKSQRREYEHPNRVSCDLEPIFGAQEINRRPVVIPGGAMHGREIICVIA